MRFVLSGKMPRLITALMLKAPGNIDSSVRLRLGCVTELTRCGVVSRTQERSGRQRNPGGKADPCLEWRKCGGFSGGEPDANYRTAWQLADKKVIGFIGSFYRYEGLDLLLEAFARLAATRSDVVLLLVAVAKSKQN